MDLMATILKPALWIRASISPCWPRPTASGLMIANVRSIATGFSSTLILFYFFTLTLLDLFQCRGHGRPQIRRRFDGMYPCRVHRRVFVFRRALAAADDGARVAHAPPRWR